MNDSPIERPATADAPARAPTPARIMSGIRRAVNVTLFLAALKLLGFASDPSVARLVDLAFVLVMAGGIVIKSRVCAGLMLLYLVASAIAGWRQFGWWNLLVTGVVVFYVVNGFVATLRYHRRVPD